jgi:hypothetical protein
MSTGPRRRDVLRGVCGLGLWLGSPATRAVAVATAGAARRGGRAPEAEPTGGGRCAAGDLRIGVERLAGNPIIRPHQDGRMGGNVQGPSLIRVPNWIANPLGRYYLYFADHKGAYIRLAYADRLEGPWRTHEPGSLQLAESLFLTEPAPVPEGWAPAAGAAPAPPPPAGASAAGSAAGAPTPALSGFASGAVEGVPTPLESATLPHIASPDAHAREDLREIVLYYHGLEGFRTQRSRVATSKDGIHFTARPELVGSTYLRAFRHDGQWYILGMPGMLFRSRDGLSGFEQGPTLFPPTMRHAGALVRGRTLFVFWTRVGDSPEHILLSTIDLDGDWSTWRAGEPIDVLYPERDWEGADLPPAPSVRDAINVRVRQLRDPAMFEEAGRVYLLYSVAGESGIAIAELELDC